MYLTAWQTDFTDVAIQKVRQQKGSRAQHATATQVPRTKGDQTSRTSHSKSFQRGLLQTYIARRTRFCDSSEMRTSGRRTRCVHSQTDWHGLHGRRLQHYSIALTSKQYTDMCKLHGLENVARRTQSAPARPDRLNVSLHDGPHYKSEQVVSTAFACPKLAKTAAAFPVSLVSLECGSQRSAG